MLKLVAEQITLAEQQDPRGRRYNKDIISLALTLWTTSPMSYKKMLQSGYIIPAASTLSLYKNCVQQKAGLNQDMFRWMSKEAKRQELTEAGYSGGLVLDEMNIQKDLQISNRGGDWRMVGIKDLGLGSNAMSQMSKKGDDVMPTEHVLQFLFHGITGFRMPFACYPTTQANACDLYVCVWDAISRLADWGFHVDYLSLDGSSNNRAFIKMLFEGKPLDNNITIIDRADPSRKVIIIPDPSHIIKKVRNSAFNSGQRKEHTGLMMVDGHAITWSHWEEAFEWCSNRDINPVAPHPKLSKDVTYLTTQAKMRNVYAEETLNERMLITMELSGIASR